MSRLAYSRTAWRLMDLALGPRMRLSVRRVMPAGLPPAVDAVSPLLLVSNHTSWWDGFLLKKVHEILHPGSTFHPVMLEYELGRRPFLRLLGAVGITPGSPGTFRRLLRTLQAARRKSTNLTVVYFPQGRIWPSHRRPLGFKEGVRLVADALAPVTLLPVGLHIEPGATHRASLAFVSAAPLVQYPREPVTSEDLEARVTCELDKIHGFLNTHGEGAEDLWPPPWDRLPAAAEGGRNESAITASNQGQ